MIYICGQICKIMNYYADIQGFKNLSTNMFILKEFALVSNDIVMHYTIKPPYSMNKIKSSKMLYNIKWLIKYYHGLKWNDGDVSMNDLRGIIYEAFVNNHSPICIFVKGIEKENWMNNFLKNTFYQEKNIVALNVEPRMHWPKMSVLQTNYPHLQHCDEHTQHEHGIVPFCALKNAMIMKEYSDNN